MTRIKTGSTVSSRVLLSLLTGILCLWHSGALAGVTASVDRTSISEFDVLTLRVRTSDQLVDLEPDFSAVERDFEILNTQTSRNSSFSITNGRTTSVVYKDYILSLKPKRLGTLTIPAIIVSGAGTTPISIHVAKQSAVARQQMQQLVFLETDVDTREVYVQGQIIYRLKLFYTEGATGQFPLPPVLEDAIVEVIENEKRYQSIVNGKGFHVIERRFAIFPQRSGELVIPGEEFIGTFNTGGFRSQSRRINAVSEPLVITVKRAPAAFSGADWIPARSLVISESWSEEPPTFQVGEPINRELALSTVGVSGSLLPPLSDLLLPNAKVYSDPPTTKQQIRADGISTTQITVTSIVPTEAGELTLPEIRISWWNITTDREEFAIVPAATYQILPATGIGVLAPRVTVPITAPGQSTTDREPGNPVWQYIAIALGVLWLVSTWQWFAMCREVGALKSAGTTQYTAAFDDPDEASHYKAFTQACRGHQAAAAHRQLFLWAKARYPQLYSLNDLAQQAVSAPHASAMSLADEIADLEAVLFCGAGDKSSWQGSNLAALVAELRRADEVKEKSGALVTSLNPA